jgi:hypothetical protein
VLGEGQYSESGLIHTCILNGPFSAGSLWLVGGSDCDNVNADVAVSSHG